MGDLRRLATLTLLLTLLVPGASAPSVASVAGAPPVATDPGVVVAAPRAQESARTLRHYWTAARMAAAVPIEELLPSLGGAADAAATAPARTAPRQVRAPRTTGKLFFTVDGADAVCSAAAILTKKRNQVITAGHCVHSGPNRGLLGIPNPYFFSDWVFVPRYRNGRVPHGRWVAKDAYAFNGWINNESFRHDQAILTFEKRNRRRLVDVVGGNEVVWGKDPRQWGVRIWGWPAQAPYDGETAKRCDGRTSRFEDTPDAAMPDCDLTGGASGGPWLLPRGRTEDTGRIWAVTSRRLLAEPVLLAHPIPGEIRRMIRAANG